VRAAAAERAPATLRARVALARPPLRAARRIGALAVAGAAAMAATIVLAVGGGPTETPSVADATALGERPPAAPVPDVASDAVALTRPRGAGLPFPEWQSHFGWKAIGMRSDRLDDRPATTVFYARRSQVVAYTIVGGGPLPVGARATRATREGTALRSLVVHGRRTVTWLRRGHTCVLSGTTATGATLLRLAAWRGGDKLPY
jgi:hypothetical protein